jgi:hypothetical protein
VAAGLEELRQLETMLEQITDGETKVGAEQVVTSARRHYSFFAGRSHPPRWPQRGADRCRLRTDAQAGDV